MTHESSPQGGNTGSQPLPLRGLAMILLFVAIVLIAWGVYSAAGKGGDGSAISAGSATTSSSAVAQPQTATLSATAAPAPASSEAAPAASSAAPSSAESSAPSSEAAPAAPATAEPVTVLNNSTVQGLAGRVAQNLTAGGSKVASVGNWANSEEPSSVVLYDTPAQKAQAEQVAQKLGISAAERGDKLPGGPAGIVVVVTQDLA